ncbi:MAG: serine/threonine protein kinase [Proteobacteria bacterium]|nr:serine/threonine protein kinase [Pseudomonadota bacterium]
MPPFPPDLTHTWAEEDLDVDADGRLHADDGSVPSGEAWSAELLGADLEPTYTLGQGGTANVIAATQHALGREVAVKSLRNERDNPAARAALIREAKVLARLDHPGVVPVHFLTPDATGRPQLVMEKVDGLRWSELIRDPDLLRSLGRSEDHLEEHLRILRRVCEALHYAHERGILHRDLKPDNVMVGRHGQVWLMDWGMAVAIASPADTWLRPAHRIRQVAGTPGYLAPEMALGQGDQIGRHTDVYQVGATLHQVLTGSMRHPGEDVLGKLAAAVVSVPHTYEEEVPPKLAEIANTCCAQDPEDRYASAAEVLAALRAYREESGARDIAMDAHRLADEMLQAIAARSYSPALSSSLDEVRFAYAQALRLAPSSTAIQAELQRFLVTTATAALDVDDLDAAARCLDSLPEPDPALSKRIHLARRERAERSAEFAVLRDLHDVSSPGRKRQLYFAGVAISSLIWFTLVDYGVQQGWWLSNHLTLILAFASVTVLFGLVGARLIPAETLSRGNTIMRRALKIRVFGAVPFYALAGALGSTVPITLGLHMLLQGSHILVVTNFLGGDGGLRKASAPSVAASLIYFAAAGVMTVAPEVPFLVFGAATGGAQAMLGMRDRRMRQTTTDAR